MVYMNVSMLAQVCVCVLKCVLVYWIYTDCNLNVLSGMCIRRAGVKTQGAVGR